MNRQLVKKELNSIQKELYTLESAILKTNDRIVVDAAQERIEELKVQQEELTSSLTEEEQKSIKLDRY